MLPLHKNPTPALGLRPWGLAPNENSCRGTPLRCELLGAWPSGLPSNHVAGTTPGRRVFGQLPWASRSHTHTHTHTCVLLQSPSSIAANRAGVFCSWDGPDGNQYSRVYGFAVGQRGLTAQNGDQLRTIH